MTTRFEYAPQSAHKGHQVTRGLGFQVESLGLACLAIAATVAKYAALLAPLFN